MDSIVTYVCLYANDAHWIIFLLMMLSGLNLPISEDILLVTAGVVGSLCIPDQIAKLYVWVFLGSWISAWECYWIGRQFGPKLYGISWFSRFVNPERIQKLHDYFERFGVLTFIVGRFFPGGVRNALFISSGLGKMPFLLFICRDGLACLISTATLFSLGYHFGTNYRFMIQWIKSFQMIGFAMVLVGALSYLLYSRYKKSLQGVT